MKYDSLIVFLINVVKSLILGLRQLDHLLFSLELFLLKHGNVLVDKGVDLTVHVVGQLSSRYSPEAN